MLPRKRKEGRRIRHNEVESYSHHRGEKKNGAALTKQKLWSCSLVRTLNAMDLKACTVEIEQGVEMDET